MHSKNFRAESEDAERNAVEFCKDKSWAVPNLRVSRYAVISEPCTEMFAFMDTVTSDECAFRLLEACFAVMRALHSSGCLHLDFHPKNLVLSTIIRDGAVTVTAGGSLYGVYCIDFETMWHSSLDAGPFDLVGDIWNDIRDGGMGRLPHSAYSVQGAGCYDMYTFCTYCIRFVTNKHFDLAKHALYSLCGLDSKKDLPCVVATKEGGREQRYHTYLMAPNKSVKSAARAVELFDILRKLVDAVAVRHKSC